MNKIIEVSDLTKIYRSRRVETCAVDSISFSLHKGEVLGLLGPNGAGKTTTIQMLLGTLSPTSGSIHCFGKNFDRHRVEIMQQVSFASSYTRLPHRLTVRENLEVYGRLYGLSAAIRKERIRSLLKQFDAWALKDKPFGMLSAGQMTRVQLAKAFIAMPRICLLDEPTASLDPEIAHEVRAFIRNQQREHGVSMIYTSHNMDEISEVCDRVVFLKCGKILACDTPANLARRSSTSRLTLAVDSGKETLEGILTSRELSFDKNGALFLIDIDEQAIAPLLSEIANNDIRYSNVHIERPLSGEVFSQHSQGGRVISTSRISGIFLRYTYLFRHSLDRMCDAVYWPIMDLILWGLTTRWISEAGGAIPNILLMMLTAIVFWQIVWRANYEVSVNLLEEFWNFNLVNLFSSPLRPIEWACGVMMVGAIKTMVTIVVGVLASWILYSLNIFSVGLYFLPFLVSLIIFGWSLGFTASALIMFFGPRIQALAWAMGFLLAPFSAVYYPLSVLPGWAQTIGSALPTTYVFEGMRMILSNGTMPLEMLITSFALNALYLIASLKFFLFMFEKSREKGLARND